MAYTFYYQLSWMEYMYMKQYEIVIRDLEN